LSYTTFEYSNLKLTSGAAGFTAQFNIRNTGKVAGAEVAQLYVHSENSGVRRPEQELKGFQKVFLKPGEIRTVSLPLTQSAFAYYSPEQKAWVAGRGDYEIIIGSSSRDRRLKGELTLNATVTWADANLRMSAGNGLGEFDPEAAAKAGIK
jgi:beta-glucosidase